MRICKLDGELASAEIVPSVCIISIIRLIVLSRLEAFDVTGESRFLRTPIKLRSRHIRELRGHRVRNLVSDRTSDGVRTQETDSVSLLTDSRVIAACIPSLRPLAAMIWRGTHRAPTVMSKSYKTAQATSNNASSRMMWPVRGNQGETNPARIFPRLEDLIFAVDKDRWGSDVNVQGGKNRGTTGKVEINLEEVSHRDIRVKNEITMTSEAWDYKDRLY